MGSEAEGGVRLKLYRSTWCAVWHEPGRGTCRRSLRTKDRDAAEQALIDFRRELARRPAGTVAEIMAAYLDEKDQTARSPARLREAWTALAPLAAHCRPDQIDRVWCRAYVAARQRRGVAPGTIRKELSTLRAGLRWHDPHTPAVLELPPAPPPRERHLSRDEARALIAASAAPHVRLFVVLALTTAARRTALLELTWDRVDFARGIIRLGPIATRSGEGGRKGRATVPLHDLARPHLLDARRAALTGHVIEHGGRPLVSIRKGFENACTRASLKGVTPHVLRHTAAVWMAEAGIPMSEIAQYLGHSDDRITARVYARFSPDHLRKAAAAINW